MHHINLLEESAPNSGAPLDLPWALSSGSDFGTRITPDLVRAVSAWLDLVVETPGSYKLYEAVSRASGTAYISSEATGPSAEELEFEKHRERLIKALHSIKQNSPNWSGADSSISEASAATAERFLNCLSSRSVLPKIAADGEGDVMLVWEDDAVSCVVTVEPQLLHLISGPGTRGTQRIDAQRFLGVQIPPSILRHIPVK